MGLLLPKIYKSIIFLSFLVPSHGPKENNQGYYKICSTLLLVYTAKYNYAGNVLGCFQDYILIL